MALPFLCSFIEGDLRGMWVPQAPRAGCALLLSAPVPIGAQITVTSVTQVGATITVNGTGFSSFDRNQLLCDRDWRRHAKLGQIECAGQTENPADHR